MSQPQIAPDQPPIEPTKGPTGGASPSHRWWILGVIGIAQLMVVLDATIVNIALPSAQGDLGFSDGDRQWVVTSYALAFGSLLLLGGRIADLFGIKVTFLTGLVGFAAASALGGAASSFEVLVTARALQGVFGALLAPAALSLLTTTFTDAKERAKAFSVYGAIAGAGGAIGLLLGGVLTEQLNWRWTLYVNLIFAAVAFLGGAALLARTGRVAGATLDVPGTVLVSAGLFGLVYGFANAESHDWGHPATWGCLTAGVALLAAFGWWQTRSAHPLLPLRVLLERDRGASFVAVLLSGVGLFGVFLFLTYYLQLSLGYSPIETGLAFLPMIGGLMVSAALVGTVLLPRLGPRVLVTAGMGLGAAGLAWLTALDLDSGYAADVMPPTIVAGLGIGLVIAPAMNLATAGVRPEDAGVASATVNTMQQVGGSIGTAVLNTLAAGAASDFLRDKDPTDPVVRAQAGLESYATAFWWSAAFFVAGMVASFLIYRRGVPAAASTSGPPAVHM
ncbi:MFS transporter [Streptomyces radicis]|uniref:DHA2 family efflux MFS transporter permease subunit n=1 Tax=Streptomyces radicis TaxID=1750517 RepID=A0A3A9VZC1_9ACTN|nr:MFS transporter [Streptomyces radicis]RKN05523.1 DHA2 family efflux MFS transporter permease subunit [Streptomyces radicis]RKN17392.1 DHA2 family efflux MFS transporter permease subunit [Streptomyces radicis]